MLANMACSLIEHKRIQTTTAKAKALKRFVEPIITKAKAENNDNVERNTHNRRIVFSYLRNKEAVSQLFAEVAEKVADRPGGYTRIIKLGNRLGDNAEMALIELVDFNETYDTGGKKKSSRRRKKAADTPAQPAAVKVEATVEEAAPALEVAEEVAAPDAHAAPEAEVAAKETAAPEEPTAEGDEDTKRDAGE